MLRSLAERSDFLTYEIESVNAEVLKELSRKMPVNPSPKTLAVIKDKLAQKRFLQEHGIPVALRFSAHREKTPISVQDCSDIHIVVSRRAPEGSIVAATRLSRTPPQLASSERKT